MKRFALTTLALSLVLVAGCSDDLLAPAAVPDGRAAVAREFGQVEGRTFNTHEHILLGRQVDFWEWGLEHPANGDIELYSGKKKGNVEYVWKIEEGTKVYQRDYNLLSNIMKTRGNKILDPSGNLVCTARPVAEPLERGFSLTLNAADGTVLLTTWNHYVFSGEVKIPPLGSSDEPSLLQNDVLYSFKNDQLFFGRWTDGIVAMTATARIEKANPMRKVVLAVLVAGYCGSSGLPPG